MISGDRSRPVMPPTDLFLTEEQFFVAAKQYPLLRILTADNAASAAMKPPNVAVNRKAEEPLSALKAFLASHAVNGSRVLLLAESAGRRETIAEYLAEHGLVPTPSADFAAFVEGESAFMLGTGPISGGFLLPPDIRHSREGGNPEATPGSPPSRGRQTFGGLAIITENELYAATARPRGRRDEARRSSLEGWLRDLSELKIGDPVVHEAHGIGRYKGLVHMDYGDRQRGVPASRIRRRRHALRAGLAAARHLPLQRRRPRGDRAAQTRLRPVGKGQARKPPSRCATPPPNC
jgi:transcription-repair coupling factor (superfamily II helicase)